MKTVIKPYEQNKKGAALALYKMAIKHEPTVTYSKVYKNCHIDDMTGLWMFRSAYNYAFLPKNIVMDKKSRKWVYVKNKTVSKALGKKK